MSSPGPMDAGNPLGHAAGAFGHAPSRKGEFTGAPEAAFSMPNVGSPWLMRPGARRHDAQGPPDPSCRPQMQDIACTLPAWSPVRGAEGRDPKAAAAAAWRSNDGLGVLHYAELRLQLEQNVAAMLKTRLASETEGATECGRLPAADAGAVPPTRLAGSSRAGMAFSPERAGPAASGGPDAAGGPSADDSWEGGEDRRGNEVSPELQAARHAAAAGEGLSGCTTVMIRHIPYKYQQRKLLREINSAGFAGRYDFFYLPMDPRSRSNRGFAFVNFATPEVAEGFYHSFHGRRLHLSELEKVLAVMPADLQGFEENAKHYAASFAEGRKAVPHNKPLFLDSQESQQRAAAGIPFSSARMTNRTPSHDGTALIREARGFPVICSSCGSARPSGGFCGNCGARLVPNRSGDGGDGGAARNLTWGRRFVVGPSGGRGGR